MNVSFARFNKKSVKKMYISTERSSSFLKLVLPIVGMMLVLSISLASAQSSSVAATTNSYWVKARDLMNPDNLRKYTDNLSLEKLPSMESVMKVPEKLLRAELAMLDEEIRMAQNMMQNPIAATINAPNDLAQMLSRMARELES